MEHAQLKTDGSYDFQITTHGNVEWDSTHYCPASALTAEEAKTFRVVPLLETSQPDYNAETHSCFRDGGELVNGGWQYKWTITALTPEQIAAALQAKREGVVVNPWPIREALNIKGWRDEVEAAVAAADIKTKDAWLHAKNFKRLDPLVINLALLLGKTEIEMDDLFALAMTLQEK